MLSAQSPVTASTPEPEQSPAVHRSPHRVTTPDSVDTSSPVAFMNELRESLTDPDGKPHTSQDDPTNVWCLLDEGMYIAYAACSFLSASMHAT